MIKAIIVMDKLLQSIVLSVLRDGYTMDTTLVHSLTHHQPEGDTIFINDVNNVLVRPVNDFISLAIVYEAEGVEEGGVRSSQVFKAPAVVVRLMRQLQRHVSPLNAVDVTKSMLPIKQRLQQALELDSSALKGPTDTPFYFIDAVIKNNDKICAVKDNLFGPLVLIKDATGVPVMLVYDQDRHELECTIGEGIGVTTVTFHSTNNACDAKERDVVKLRPPSLSHHYKHPVWTICSGQHGGRYSLCHPPMSSHADVTFEGVACKSGDIYRFYF